MPNNCVNQVCFNRIIEGSVPVFTLQKEKSSNYFFPFEWGNQCYAIYSSLVIPNIVTCTKFPLWSLCFFHVIIWNFPETCCKYAALGPGYLAHISLDSGNTSVYLATFDLEIFWKQACLSHFHSFLDFKSIKTITYHRYNVFVSFISKSQEMGCCATILSPTALLAVVLR